MGVEYLINWDGDGERTFETGVKNCVLYPRNNAGAYTPGVAWNGISSINESPSGAEANAIYADDMKYLNLYSAEEFGASIEAYTYPDEFELCDGTASPVTGMTIGQQARKMFGLCYRTTIGNDIDGNDHGYKLHLLYGCQASPSEKSYQTINDSPEAIAFSWEISTTPVAYAPYKPTALVTIDSTKFVGDEAEAKLNSLLAVLYGTPADPDVAESVDIPARLPLPSEVASILSGT